MTPRLIAYAVAAVALAGLLGWAIHTYNEHLRDQGRAEIQVKFDAYRKEIARLATEREVANMVKDAQVIATNEAALNAYQKTLADIAADRDGLSKRLRNSQARTCSAAGTQVDHRPAVATASPEPSSEEAVDRLYDEYDRACQGDAAQLDALLAELKPQL